MRTKSMSLIIAVLLIAPGYAMGDDEAEVTGSLELGLRGVDDQDDRAKFQEYRDLEDGLFGNFLLDADKGANYFELQGENIGRDDQNYLLKGGQYGKFKYRMDYDETPHNLSFDAKTFYSEVGGRQLTFTGLTPAPEEDWNFFDYYVDRKKYGGELELSLNSPFFVKIGVRRLETDGLKPFSGGDFSAMAEMPEPVDYQTNDLNLMAGYRSKTVNFTLTGVLSSFDNDNLYLNWENPNSGNTDLSALPPENDYGKIGANLTVKQLPYLSTFSLNGSYAKLENDFSISDINLTAPTALNRSIFDGEIVYSNIAAAFVSRPSKELDSRIYYRYTDKDNKSDIISYDDVGDLVNNTSYLYDYTRNDAGVDIGYKLPWRTKVEIGYEYQDVDRNNRDDATKTKDNTFFVQLKNSLSEYVTGKLKYSHLKRNADTDFDLTSVTDIDAEFVAQYVQRYDVTDKSRDEVKVTLEFYPLDSFDLGFDYSYVMNDYDDVTLGRTEDTRHQFYLDFLWHRFSFMNLSGFVGYEITDADSNHYNFAAGSGTPVQTADPTVDDGNPDSYLWSQDIKDHFWTYGLSSQVKLWEDVLKLVVSWEYQKSNGKSTFSSQGSTTLDDLDSYDDYSKKRLEAKFVYAFDKKLNINLGYVYEKYTFEDIQYDGYVYNPGTNVYLTGAYADQDYEANIAYLAVRYVF